MIRAITALIAITFNANTASQDADIQWLSWPVTGKPFESIDPEILVPRAEDRFDTEVRRDVILGLKSDGTVVWKYVDREQEQPKEEIRMQLRALED